MDPLYDAASPSGDRRCSSRRWNGTAGVKGSGTGEELVIWLVLVVHQEGRFESVDMTVSIACRGQE